MPPHSLQERRQVLRSAHSQRGQEMSYEMLKATRIELVFFEFERIQQQDAGSAFFMSQKQQLFCDIL